MPMLEPLGQALRQPWRENALRFKVAAELARDVAADPTERPARAPELLGVSVALMGDERELADPRRIVVGTYMRQPTGGRTNCRSGL
jgi:hypothetical protein